VHDEARIKLTFDLERAMLDVGDRHSARMDSFSPRRATAQLDA
jgi:hypothetical protein